MSVPARIGVGDLAALLDAIPAQSARPVDVAAQLARKADVLDGLADASGDEALTHDARVLAAAARRAARDMSCTTTTLAATGSGVRS